jgi:hypothetical protein
MCSFGSCTPLSDFAAPDPPVSFDADADSVFDAEGASLFGEDAGLLGALDAEDTEPTLSDMV